MKFELSFREQTKNVCHGYKKLFVVVNFSRHFGCGLSGVAAAVFCGHFSGRTRGIQIVLKQTHHSLLVGLNGKEVDDWIQAAVEIHE